MREGVLVAIAAAASSAFLLHGTFYLDGRPASPNFRIEPFLFVTGLAYLFLRSVVIAVAMWPTRAQNSPLRCPECGHRLDVPSSKRLHAARDIERSPTPTEVASTEGLRRAVDAAQSRMESLAVGSVVRTPAPSPTAENLTGRQLIAALDDPDFLERARHGPTPTAEPRVRR
jgi:hypothetical protein